MNRIVFGALMAGVFALQGCGGQGQGSQVPVQGQAHQATTSSGEIVYVSTKRGIRMFAYPGWADLGTIKWRHENGGLICADSSNGNVFAPEGDDIYEYAHGGTTVIGKLPLPEDYETYSECAVDPITGTLAVTAETSTSTQTIDAELVYPNGQGPPTIYVEPRMQYLQYPTYDGSSNLFVGGAVKGKTSFAMAELEKGGKQFRILQVAGFEGGIKPEWDGHYIVVAVTDDSCNFCTALYQLSFTGKAGTIVGSYLLEGSYSRTLYAVQGNEAFALLYHERHKYNRGIGVWNYPASGEPIDRHYSVSRTKYDSASDIAVSVSGSR
jgi:hypothetical protein